MIIAVVGSGGKTTTIKRLAKHYLEEGKKVFVTTTTHMFVEEDTLLSDNPAEIIEHLELNGYVMAGVLAESRKSAELEEGAEDEAIVGVATSERYVKKIKSLSQETFLEVCKHADLVLVEADGSKHMPLKCPDIHEPVIPSNTDEILVICGLHGLGKPAREVCHRLELVKEVLGIEDDTLMQPIHVQQLVKEGYVMPLKDKYPNKTITVQATHDDSLYQRVVATLIKEGREVTLLKEEWFFPQPKLIICGGGHVGREVAELASKLDFYVKVIDDRKELVTEERFPTADERICDSFDNLLEYLEPHAFLVVVTPDHKADYKCVRTILKTDYAYLGMIGSKGKVAKTKSMLSEEGFTESQIQSIHAPIGLPIGAATPTEIAISILAEIIQEKNKKCSTYADKALLDSHESGVLCIIIEKKGSAPRGVGSMMLVCKDKVVGSIGGGLAEYLAIEKARTIENVEIGTYRLEKTLPNGIDMICGGNIQVLFVPI